MTMIAFVIWMIGWPTACAISSAYSYKCGKTYNSNVSGLSALTELIIWATIGSMLWHSR